MNIFVLMIQGWLLYPENYTKEQLEENYIAAYASFSDAYITRATNRKAVGLAYCIAFHAYRIGATPVEYWLNEYFNETGENRQDYIDAAHKENN